MLEAALKNLGSLCGFRLKKSLCHKARADSKSGASPRKTKACKSILQLSAAWVSSRTAFLYKPYMKWVIFQFFFPFD